MAMKKGFYIETTVFLHNLSLLTVMHPLLVTERISSLGRIHTPAHLPTFPGPNLSAHLSRTLLYFLLRLPL